MDEQILKVFSRIKATGDGIEFVDYVNALFKDNVDALIMSLPEESEFRKGQLYQLKQLIKAFETCDDKLAKIAEYDKSKEEVIESGWN